MLFRSIDCEWLFIDETYVRAHQHSTGAATDTDGTMHDIKVAPELLSKIPLDATDYISADKGYDSESFREIIINQGANAIISKNH